VDIFDNDLVERIEKKNGGFSAHTKKGKTLDTKTILVATGSHRKRLNVPGEREFEGKGVVFCSTCDAPLFGGKTVAVVGGGNAGLEAVNDLLPYASKIYLLEYEAALRGDPITQEKVLSEKNVSVILNAAVEEIVGDEMVCELRYKDRIGGELKSLPVEGVFVEIGVVPSSDCVRELVGLNQRGEIVVDHKTQATSLNGIWAAGDVTDALYRQNNVSVGNAVTAVLNIYDHLNTAHSYPHDQLKRFLREL
jgi:alkyl hydroperoxide reductase subunit F